MKIDKFKTYIKEPAFILFFILIAFVAILFYKALQFKETFSIYNRYTKTINRLFIINNNFDIFLSKKLTFINYDDIANLEKEFETKISILKKESLFSKNRTILHAIDELNQKFHKKANLIERYKSYNAMTTSSMIYIFDTITNINTNRYRYIQTATFNLAKLFIGINLNKKDIEKSIKQLNNSCKLAPKDIQYICNDIKITISNIYTINSLAKELKHIRLQTNLNSVNLYIDSFFYNYLKSLKNHIFILLIISLLLLILFIYKHSLFFKNTKKLISFVYAVDNSDNTVIMTDKDRNITYVNDAFIRNTGYKKEEVLGKNPKILKSGLLPQEFYDTINKKLDKGEKWSGEFINKDKNGKIFYERASIVPMHQGKKLIGYLAVKLNITDYIEQEKKVAFLATHDQLTSLKNRRAMEYEIKQTIEHAKQNGTKIALLFLDLDNFKTINDTLGHDTGDLFLKYISDRLIHNMDKEDKIYRFGGDEFVIVITKNTTKDNIYHIAKRIINLIQKPVTIENQKISTSASIGISIYPEDGNDLQTILKNADIAMYSSKVNGKNGYKFYNEHFSQELQRQIDIERELANALENDEFYVVYQPKYSLQSKKILGLEALLRWNNKKLGNMPPNIFIPIAENLNLIYDIGLFAFSQSCKDFKQLKKYMANLEHISINVSIAQLNNPKILHDFQEAMDKEKVSSCNFALEITETALMRNVEENIKLLKEIKKLGFIFCLDDFGTGYSSLNYLVQLPIDNIKIDKSFIDIMFNGDKEAGMIKTIKSISDNFGYNTVAEGIETKDQESALEHMGIDYGQGFYFSKPLRKDELLKKFGK